GRVLGEERVPVAAPDDLDDVPTGPAEGGLQFLNHLAVAADGAVEPLQVAVDDEDQVVELFATGERQGAERFRLVALAVADEAPDVPLVVRDQSAVFEVAVEAGLVNRHD